MGRTACTEPQCLYSTATPLLPLWTVRPVQSLSACTVQLYLYSPQCLYNGALYLFYLILPFNAFNAELNPICHLLALLGAHNILHVCRVRVKVLSAYGSTAIGPRHRALFTSSDQTPIAANSQLLHFTTLTSKLTSSL